MEPSAEPAATHTFVLVDLAGYTALTEAHGDERAADAAREFCQAVRELLRAHDAEEVKTMGDGILIHVEAPDQAVALAQRIVTGYGARHLTLGVRAGVHTGSAVRRGDDWFGHAVNLAARVVDRAGPGEVVVTGPTRERLDPGTRLDPRGPQVFKNVAQPIEVYVVVLEDPPPPLPVDPVCHMAVDPDRAFARETVAGVEYVLCSPECARAFAASPATYVG